jgi:hypothetical protein
MSPQACCSPPLRLWAGASAAWWEHVREAGVCREQPAARPPARLYRLCPCGCIPSAVPEHVFIGLWSGCVHGLGVDCAKLCLDGDKARKLVRMTALMAQTADQPLQLPNGSHLPCVQVARNHDVRCLPRLHLCLEQIHITDSGHTALQEPVRGSLCPTIYRADTQEPVLTMAGSVGVADSRVDSASTSARTSGAQHQRVTQQLEKGLDPVFRRSFLRSPFETRWSPRMPREPRLRRL